jgi:hypothetical protein
VRKVRGTAPPQREAPQEPVIRAAAHPLHEQLADTTKQFIQYEKDRRKKDWLTRQTMKRRNEFTPVQSVAQNAPLALRTTRGYPEARKSARPPIRSEGLNKETSRRSVRLVFSFEPITRVITSVLPVAIAPQLFSNTSTTSQLSELMRRHSSRAGFSALMRSQ